MITSYIQPSIVQQPPFAFTEQGVAMLSSVLNSERAIHVNIQIIRIFTKLRLMLTEHTEIRLEIEKIKNKLDNQDKNMEIVFPYLDKLLEKQKYPNPPIKRIGFFKKGAIKISISFKNILSTAEVPIYQVKKVNPYKY